MKRFISVSMCLMLSAIAIYASANEGDYNYFHRGIFVSVDFAPGAILNDIYSVNMYIVPIVNLILRTGLRTMEVSRLDVKDIMFRKGKRVLLVWGKGMS